MNRKKVQTCKQSLELSVDKKKIMLRADASEAIGSGHLMRMLALGQLLSDYGHRIFFITVPNKTGILDYINAEPFEIFFINSKKTQKEQEKEFLRIVKIVNPDWVVLDGYIFSLQLEIKIKKSGVYLLKVSDFSERQTVADVLLDQNYGSEERTYLVNPKTILLRGLKHVLLRREFYKLTCEKIVNQNISAPRLLISLGGGSEITDKANLRIVNSFAEIFNPNWSATLVIGKMGLRSKELMEAIEKVQWPIKVLDHVSSMAGEMLDADIGIFAGGSIMWEALYMKIPYLAFSLNLRQKEYLEFLEQRWLCRYLGMIDSINMIKLKNQVIEFVENNEQRQNILAQTEELFERNSVGSALLNIIGKYSDEQV